MRQDQCWRMKPDRVGPTVGPRATTRPTMPRASPRRSGGKRRSTTFWMKGIREPAATAWMILPASRMAKCPVEKMQTREPTRKVAIMTM